jgi:hypothetical protein
MAAVEAQTPTPTGSLRPVDDPDAYAVYAAILPRERVRAFVVRAETGMMRPCETSGSEYDEWKPVVDNYLEENASRRLLMRRAPLVDPYSVVPESEIEASFSLIERGPREGPWTGFYRRYPGSGGYVELSAVGFDAAKQRAMVYVAHYCGTLCGGGRSHLLEKVDGEWREIEEYSTLVGCRWIS